MGKIYFGKYISKSSFIHGLNPLAKLLALSMLMGAVGFSDSFTELGFFTIVLVLAIVLSKITFREFYRSVRTFRFLILFTFIIQIFFTDSGDFIMYPDAATLNNALLLSLKFTGIISFSALFTLTTSPADIARSIYVFIRPFKKIGVDTKEVAISLLVAVRFIPILFDEADKIITAQKLRGLWADKKGFKNKFSFIIKTESFIIPLFTRLVRYAEKISITLTYRPGLEDVMGLPIMAKADMFFIGMAALLVGVAYAL